MLEVKKDAILLVEDNPDDELLTLRALKKTKLVNEIVVAHDGEEALEYLLPEKNGNDLPIMVLLDLKMPKVSGLDVLRAIRSNERTKNLPVVVFTSSSEEKDIVESYRLGVNSYVRKPVDFSQFLEAVERIGLYWMVLNESPYR
jgi:CheY-like chemotaxis protein